MSTSTQYAHVILPLAVDGYTYAIPSTLHVQVGSLVRVPLGKSKFHYGVVDRLQTDAPKGVKCKAIQQLAYDYPLVTSMQLQLWHWLADYYCCTMGEVLKAALPTMLHHATYKPLKASYVNKIVEDVVLKRPQQIALWDRYNRLAEQGKVRKCDLIEELSISAFNTLVKKGIFSVYEKDITRLPFYAKQHECPSLSDVQQTALAQINDLFTSHNTVLLHGVTASGKTEIYLQKIRETLQQGQQVLYLVPEIALTSQLEQRLLQVLGDKMVAYHSGLSDTIRAEIYLNLLQSKGIQVVLGTRSSVFLPFQNLGLIIIDEEHEPSYKQYEPSPRYHAKNVALIMAKMLQVPTLMGSATPSVESYYWAQKGKYGYVSLTQRYNDVLLPRIEVVNRQEAFQKNRMKGMFTWHLYEKMQETLAAGQQIILFQNRRGFSSQVACESCGYVPKCKHCDVSLTYHKEKGRLKCHYCGFSLPITTSCPSCGSLQWKDKGFGTEKVVEALAQYFPQATVDRLDIDTTKNLQSYQTIIKRFALGKTQILVGTQMVAKGLDFDNVGLVGILNADNMMSLPDFRSVERAYQLMVQVSGRAGRRQKQGLVVLQTSHTDHYIMPAVLQQQSADFYRAELQERLDFAYPPFARLIMVQIRHVRADVAQNVACQLATVLQTQWGDAVLGPTEPPVSKQYNRQIRQLLIKLKSVSQQDKIFLFRQVEQLKKQYSSVDIIVDVDPI